MHLPTHTHTHTHVYAMTSWWIYQVSVNQSDGLCLWYKCIKRNFLSSNQNILKIYTCRTLTHCLFMTNGSPEIWKPRGWGWEEEGGGGVSYCSLSADWCYRSPNFFFLVSCDLFSEKSKEKQKILPISLKAETYTRKQSFSACKPLRDLWETWLIMWIKMK